MQEDLHKLRRSADLLWWNIADLFVEDFFVVVDMPFSMSYSFNESLI